MGKYVSNNISVVEKCSNQSALGYLHSRIRRCVSTLGLSSPRILLDLEKNWFMHTYHWGDVLLGQIVLGTTVVLAVLSSLANLVDLFVDLSSVMVSLLTGTSHGELNTTWMPSTNTGDLSETLVCLAGQLLGVPTRGDTLESFTLGHTNDVDHLILGKDTFDGDGLFKVSTSPVDLLRNVATIELHFHNMGLLLTLLHHAHLSMGNHTHNGTILLDASQVHVDFSFAKGISPFLGVLGESLLLRFVPMILQTRKNEKVGQRICLITAR